MYDNSVSDSQSGQNPRIVLTVNNQSHNWSNNVLEQPSDSLSLRFRRVGTEKFYCACSRQFDDSLTVCWNKPIIINKLWCTHCRLFS